MKSMIASLLLVAVVALSDAKSARLAGLRHISVGECPTITNQQDFDPVPYLGPWFEIERYEITVQDGMDCVQAIYSDLGGGVVEVHNVARTAEGDFTEIVGTATVGEPGVLLVQFDGKVVAEYHVLDTDYLTHAAVYNCQQIEEIRFQYAWVLSRNTTLAEDHLHHAHQVFEANGIDLSLFHTTYQGNDCPYVY